MSYFYGAPGTLRGEELPQREYRKPLVPRAFDEPLPLDIGRWGELAEGRLQHHDAVPTESSSLEEANSEGPGICNYFIQGKCRYGNHCRYLHDPSYLADNEMDAAMILAERAGSTKLECGICYEIILESERRFGILSDCTHSFCLPCIRDWRSSNETAETSARASTKTCPLCRTVSHFVIPCDRMVVDSQRKLKLIQEYRSETSSIPCKHFAFGEGTCPFGVSCFYAHVDKEGKPLTIGRPRAVIRSDGKLAAPSVKSSLLDFLDHK
jgi:hypothetical protein